jgi:hypothetical protein
MPSSRFSLHWILVTVLILFLGALYASTLAPGLSWAHNGADGGDFISAAATNGIPHPTGYPTYLLLAHAFQLIPVGSLAFRTNLLSAVCAVAAAVFVYLSVARLPFLSRRSSWLAGGVAALAYGLSPLVWSQAVITEVYSLQALFLALILFLWAYGVDRKPHGPGRYDIAIGLVTGLAIGNHLTTIFLFPLAFLMGGVISHEDAEKVQRRSLARRWKVRWASIGVRLGGLLVGMLVYLVLPLWAISRPAINWGNPITLKNFIWLVSGKLYAGRVFGVPLDFVVPRIQYWANLLIDQFGWVGLAIGLYGLLFSRGQSIKNFYLGTGWLFFVFSVFSIGYNSYDSDVYLIPAFLVYALWVGVGAVEIVGWCYRRKAWIGVLAGILILSGLIVPAAIHYRVVDASHDQRAENFGREVFRSAPSDAIIFTKGDEATFALRYFQFALHQRPDVVLIVPTLLPYDWYRTTLNFAYPTLEVPDHSAQPWDLAIIQANPERPMCIASYQETIEFSCQ